MYYKEDKAGQILQEGINEAGGMSSWIAAATSLLDQQPHHGAVLHLLLDVRLPADRRPGLGRRRHAGARLPVGRHRRAAPRLNGEGLQHEDGHSHILAGDHPQLRQLTTRPSPTRSA